MMHKQVIPIQNHEAPEPLTGILEAPKPYPVEALGEVMGGMALAVQDATQAPLALCGQSVLMAGALIAQGFKEIEMPHGKIPLSLFSLIIAESGERKSATDELAMKPIRLHEQAKGEQYQADLKDSIKEKTAFNEAEKSIKRSIPKDYTGEKAREWVKDELNKLNTLPPPPMMPTYTTSDATIEGVIKHFRQALPVLGIYTDEGGAFFGGHSMAKEQAKKSISLFSQAWNGKPLDMMRADKDTGVFRLYGRRLSISLMTQPVIALEALSDSLMSGQGFIARFLICYPQSNIGKRPYKAFNIAHDPRFTKYFAVMMERLEDGFMLKPEGGLDLAAITLNANSEQAYIRFHNEIEQGMANNQPYAHLRGEASKIAEQALRVAGVLTVIKHGYQCQFIDVVEMKAGIRLARYSLDELLRITNQAVIDPDTKDAIKLLEWITDKGHKLLYPVLIQQTAPNALRKKERYERALFKLIEHRYIELLENGTVVDGIKRKEVYKVLHYAD